MPESGGETDLRRAYFQANLRLIGLLLAIWAFVSFTKLFR